MIETENKVYARRCESHVEALRRAVPGCIEKVEWQCEDQLTITVKQEAGDPASFDITGLAGNSLSLAADPASSDASVTFTVKGTHD